MIYSTKSGFNHKVGRATYKSWYCHDFDKNGTCLLNMPIQYITYNR